MKRYSIRKYSIAWFVLNSLELIGVTALLMILGLCELPT